MQHNEYNSCGPCHGFPLEKRWYLLEKNEVRGTVHTPALMKYKNRSYLHTRSTDAKLSFIETFENKTNILIKELSYSCIY